MNGAVPPSEIMEGLGFFNISHTHFHVTCGRKMGSLCTVCEILPHHVPRTRHVGVCLAVSGSKHPASRVFCHFPFVIPSRSLPRCLTQWQTTFLSPAPSCYKLTVNPPSTHTAAQISCCFTFNFFFSKNTSHFCALACQYSQLL